MEHPQENDSVYICKWEMEDKASAFSTGSASDSCMPAAVGCRLVGGSKSETAGEVPCNDISTVRRMSLQPVPVSPTSRNGCLLIQQTPSPFHPPLNTPTYLIQSWQKRHHGEGDAEVTRKLGRHIGSWQAANLIHLQQAAQHTIWP